MNNYKSALVLGLGASGGAAVGLLLAEGTSVTAIDCSDDNGLADRAEKLEKEGADILLGSDDLPQGDFEVCIVSPGVAADSAWVKTIESRGIETLSELELGASRCKCPMLAITGTNGKSTMVKLCADAMAFAGRRAAAAGNYGAPLCEAASSSGDLDWLVVEVSSFQLERVKRFRPRVGVLLNVQPDHLDRHGDMKTYTEMKSRLFARMEGAECPVPNEEQMANRMGEGDIGIVLDKDLEMVKELSRGRNKWVTFGLSEQADYRYVDSRIHWTEGKIGRLTTGDKQGNVSVQGTVFANEIMGVTAAAAVTAMHACGLDSRAVESAVKSFEPLPHRMQEIARINDVRFVDDSKATNLAALHAALKMSDGALRLIAGGLLKEKDLKPVKKLLARKVRKVYLIGKAAKEMERAWGDVVQCCPCTHLEKAVRTAWEEASVGETVLLSPGCASFDQFRNFEDRGEQFVGIVAEQLTHEEK